MNQKLLYAEPRSSVPIPHFRFLVGTSKVNGYREMRARCESKTQLGKTRKNARQKTNKTLNLQKNLSEGFSVS